MGVVGYAVSLLVFNFIVLLFIYAVLRLQGHLPLNPAHVPGMSPWVAFNTAVSFATNTNWQATSGETSVSYLTQMLALARRTSSRPRSAWRSPWPSSAASRAARRASSATSGSTSRAASSTSCCRSRRRARAGPRLAGRRAEPQRADPGRRRSRAPRRRSPRARRLAGDHQGARHQRRRLLQRQLGAPVREPDAAHQLHRDARASSPSRRAHLHVRRFAGNQRQGWALFAAAMASCSSSASACIYAQRAERATRTSPGPARPGRDATQAGGNMEGKEVRFGIGASRPLATATTDTSCGAVNAAPRQPHAARGRHGDAQHRARRGRLRRRRRRPHGHAGLRHPRGVHRRADGRPHARVPGQEDRGPRDEARDARGPVLLRHAPWASRRSPRCYPPARTPCSTTGRTASPRSCTPPSRRPATTAAPSPASPRAARSGPPLGGLMHAVRPLLLHHPVPRARRHRWRARRSVPPSQRHVPDDRRRSSSCCSSASSSSSARSRSSRVYALGPIVEQFLMHAGQPLLVR